MGNKGLEANQPRPGRDRRLHPKVAQLIRLSLEQFSEPNASNMLSKSVERAVSKRANLAYLAQVALTSPAVTPPAGLLNVAGIVDGGAVASNLDALVDLLATIEGNDGTGRTGSCRPPHGPGCAN